MNKTIKLSILLALGFLVGSANITNAALFGGGASPKTSSAGSAFLSSEDVYQVDPVDSSPAYDEGTHSCEGAQQVHYHYNVSTDTRNNTHWEILHEFAIALDTDYAGGTPATNDFLENVDTSTNFLCSNGEDVWVDCSFDKDTITPGTVIYSTTGGIWDGLTITYDTLDWVDGNPRGLIWEYGTNDPTNVNVKPWLAAGDRQKEAISFQLEDYATDQTATTESWSKIEMYNFHDDGSYDHEYPADVDTDGDGTDDKDVDPDGDYLFWYGLNGRARSIFPACGLATPVCDSLTIDPTTATLNVSDVFNDVDFTLTAQDQYGNDITADSTFQYYVNKYGSANTAADADGLLNYGLGNLFFGRSPNTSDNTVRFRNTEPGDTLYAYVSDYDGASYQDECYVEVELPYCTELNITDPSGAFGSGWLGIFHGTTFNTNISVEAYSGTDSWEPFSITYDSTDDAATYDGAPDSYTTSDYTVDDYESSESGTVTVGLDDENGDGESDDVAGLCTDQFTYTLIPEITLPACEELTFLTTDPISAEDMEAGDVMIRWTATMDDGTPVLPPYYCESTNSAGTFSEVRGGPTTAHAISTSMTTLYYNGEPGDSIRCMSLNYPYCVDTLTSETSTGETYACSEIALEPAYIWTAGSKIYIDETDPDSIQDLYDEGTVCYDFTVTVEDPAFDGFLTATGYESDHSTVLSSSNIEMDINETGGNITGNPATLNITGFTEYTGSICWSDYEEEGYITLEVDDQIACFEEAELPVPLPPEEEIACTDLELSPDSIVMSSSASDAGTQTLTILVTADDSSWTGNLFVTHTGSGTLYYSDGSTSTYSDGHLVMPVSGTSTSFTITYVGGHSGDVVTASINREETLCQDALTLSQESDEEGGGGGGGGDSGSSGHGSSGGSEDECTTDINPGDDELVCGDDYEMEVCTEGEDTVTVSATDNEICYFLDEDGDGNQDSDEEENCEDNSVELEDNNDCYIVTVKDVCDETDISVEDEDHYTCFDTSLEGVAVGEFNKYIYTFNFSAQKNSYSDDGVFFAHDEDRAFYTLEYTPTGHENEIEFTDQMWDDGEITADDGGTVELATDYGDLTSGSAYNTDGRYTYTTILNYGFGDTHEEKSDALLSQLEATYTDAGIYPSFIPYVKSNDNSDDSYLIPECQYETDGSLSEDQGICYDPNHSPADSSDPKVLIENAGEIDGDQYSIRIRYVGVVNSELDCTGKSAKADTCLTEEFQNTAHVDAYPDSSLGELEDTARLVVLCSYLLTENAGDIYLNEALTGGSDLSCIYVDDNFNYTSYSNTDGLVILDDGSVSSSSSSSSSTTTYTSEFSGLTSSYCDDTGENNSLIGNLSSYVCEIVNSVSSLWKQSTVESTTDSRVDTATRNAETAQVAGDSSYSTWDELYAALKNTKNSSSNILYFNGDLSTAGALTLTGNIVVPSGAWTLVVENADLVISGEISYATTSSIADYKNLPSVAFIVQDGDIHFENSSEDNVGVYYTNQNFEGDTDGSTRSPVDQQLTIDGSLYGNIQPLLDDCRYVAPPTTEGGGLVVRYDSRILLNTPPALSEYVDVETEKGLN